LILHTIVDPSLIWESDQAHIDVKEIYYKGVQLEVRRVTENSYMIDRILSTDLSHFLDPELQPGCIIAYTLQPQD